jgi:D-amino-acid N-acetyltransferase
MATSAVDIRPLTSEDETVWRKLFLAYHEYYQISPDEKVISTTFARFLDEKEPVYGSLAVAEDGQAIGLVHWVTHRSTLAVNDYIYLHDLFVDEKVRSRGTGRQLIEHVYKDADKREAARVYWQTKVGVHEEWKAWAKVSYRTFAAC